jgi:excinuclease UvrABC nuclease subunit
MNNVEYNDKIKRIYNEIKNRKFSSFIKYYEVLSKVSSSIKDNLDVIDFLVKNSIVTVPQMDDAIGNILKDDQLLRIISNNDKKEPLQEELEILEGILSGKYNFEDFKRILLSSDLDNESIISILTHEAESSINVVKKQLPSLDSFQKDNELVSR